MVAPSKILKMNHTVRSILKSVSESLNQLLEICEENKDLKIQNNL